MATEGGPSIVTDGLVLHLDAANPKSYPGSGTTWFDLSPSNNNVTLYNSPSFNGVYFSFDGVDEYGIVAPNLKSQINNSESTTVTALANIKFIQHVDNLIGWGNANQINGVVRTWGIYARFSNLRAGYLGGIIGSTEIYNNWYFLTAIFTPSLTKGNKFNGDTNLNFNNSNISSSNTWKNISPNFDITIAKTSYYSRYMQTDIAEIKVYNKALTPEEILQNYNATKSRFNL